MPRSSATLWVEGGWLVVKRESAAADLEWQLVLARAHADLQPKVTVSAANGALEVKYGQYFVRDSLRSLRILRERKSAESPNWPDLQLPKDRQSLGHGGAEVTISGWEHDGWGWLASGMNLKRPDAWVRLLPTWLKEQRHGFSSQSDLANMFYGDAAAQDDGELLVVNRISVDMAKRLKSVRDKQITLMYQPAPEIKAQEWFNTDAPLAPNGNVMLLDFWGQWCGPCVQTLPDVEALYQRFKDRGLVVVGIHSSHGADDLGEFIRNKQLSFPIAWDEGATADKYAVQSWPNYFLIDKAGRVAWGFESKLPSDDRIVALLDEPKGEPKSMRELEGIWTCVSATMNGNPLPDDTIKTLRLTLTKDRYKTERGTDVLFDSTYKLNDSQNPPHINMLGTEGDLKGKEALGIYSLAGDILQTCYNMPGKERPSKFESVAGSETFLVIWKRQKP